jgi:hypothetical protein
MSTDFQKSITYAILSAELQATREAILNIWNVHQAWVRDEVPGSEIPYAIADATAVLPIAMRTAEMPEIIERGTSAKMDLVRKRLASRPVPQTESFDDVLG